MDLNVIIGGLLVGVLAFYLLRIVWRSLAGLWKVALRSLVAFVAIWAANMIGQFFGFHMGLNVFSALVIGVLGLPGVGLLLATKYLLL